MKIQVMVNFGEWIIFQQFSFLLEDGQWMRNLAYKL